MTLVAKKAWGRFFSWDEKKWSNEEQDSLPKTKKDYGLFLEIWLHLNCRNEKAVAVSWQFEMNKNMQIDFEFAFWFSSGATRCHPYPKLKFCMLGAPEGTGFTLFPVKSFSWLWIQISLTKIIFLMMFELKQCILFYYFIWKVMVYIYIF